ncbi:MAG: hypothetical protein HEQ13_24960 [Dolichospermum sp. DEX189]|jgi:hypothetical protein|uniref:RNA methyltransferase n=1 Tax=Aphanizomenon flos-aquae FACHB-1040 TaxID=2692887 RepID=A0ABR8BWT6_APHFL|nr:MULTISPECIES: hypothetical protein [Aphanizomenonaceae]MBD2279403.1 hypothetical protein [Aphanizomenon flos-aquae FACHB-1040]MBE9258854.1 hypothetical protein [Dolichospermum sp. LEGE 00246]MBO1072397.1 hypothetical protein [Dolichospermum sp. DEX189]
MTTYKQLQDYIKTKYQVTVKTCWIAHAKEQLGLPLKASQRSSEGKPRVYPCPLDRLPLIREAFEHFHLL